MENTTSTPPPEAPPPATVPGSDVPKDAKTMAMLAHLLGGIFCFLPPLIIWLVKKDDHPFIAQEAREALNFQITVLLVYVALTITLILSIFTPVIWLISIVLGIVAGMKANEGNGYRYPVALRLIK